MDSQLSGFTMSYFDGAAEHMLYDNAGVEHGTGTFEIPVHPAVIATAIIIRRAGTLTLCEVEVYEGQYLSSYTSIGSAPL